MRVILNVSLTRQTSKFKNILDSWVDSMNLANEATNASGNAEANQEKWEESVNGKMQKISTQWDSFWLNFYNSDFVNGSLDAIVSITGALDNLSESLGGGTTAALAFAGALAFKSTIGNPLWQLIKGGQGRTNVINGIKGKLDRSKYPTAYIFIIEWVYYHRENCVMV